MSVFKILLNRGQWNDKIETIVEYICIFTVTIYNQYIHYHNYMYNLGTFSNKVALNRYLLRKKKIIHLLFLRSWLNTKTFSQRWKLLPKIFSKNFFLSRSFILKSTPNEKKKKVDSKEFCALHVILNRLLYTAKLKITIPHHFLRNFRKSSHKQKR